MKLLIFAHTPPPYHGQSVAVQHMLENFGGDRRKAEFRGAPPNRFGLECYHINARFSQQLEDVGEFQSGKILLIIFYCLQALWCRFRYGVKNLYYVPAPGKPIALYRDWIVMLLCRPFFKRIIFHWHAAGLAKWLETSATINVRSFTFSRMKHADLSIVLSDFTRMDAEKLLPRRLKVVGGGISDPCPEFAKEVLPARTARIERRKKILAGESPIRDERDETIKVLFLAHCTRTKGVFDTVEGVALANEKLAAANAPARFHLSLLGAFASEAEQKELREFIRVRNLSDTVTILGFVSGERKKQELNDADLLCFPTYYAAEGQPANILEAFAFGLPVLATRWRSIPEMLPENYPGFVSPKSPAEIAEKLRFLCVQDFGSRLRDIFLQRFTLEKHLAGMAEALGSMDHT